MITHGIVGEFGSPGNHLRKDSRFAETVEYSLLGSRDKCFGRMPKYCELVFWLMFRQRPKLFSLMSPFFAKTFRQAAETFFVFYFGFCKNVSAHKLNWKSQCFIQKTPIGKIKHSSLVILFSSMLSGEHYHVLVPRFEFNAHERWFEQKVLNLIAPYHGASPLRS